MVKNNKGTVLVIAVVAMSIMIIIGFICLRIYSNQSILDTRDVVKQRLYYSAIGSVEAMKGFLSKKVAENIQSRSGKQDVHGNLVPQGDITANGENEGFLAYATRNGAYEPFKWTNADPGLFGSYAGKHDVFDASMHPPIITSVKLIRLNSKPDGDFYAKGGTRLASPFNGIAAGQTAPRKAYVIEAKTSTEFKTALNSINKMEVVARFYFVTQKIGDGTAGSPHRHAIHCVGWRIEN